MVEALRVPEWLRDELLNRGHVLLTRSETLQEMHARIERETGQIWDDVTRRWVDR